MNNEELMFSDGVHTANLVFLNVVVANPVCYNIQVLVGLSIRIELEYLNLKTTNLVRG
jgi:hypothetical protein